MNYQLLKSALLLWIGLLGFGPVFSQNQSLLFDGNDDRVQIPNNSVFNISNNKLTIEAWINANAWRTNQWQGTIVGKDVDPQLGYALRTGDNGRLSFNVGNGSGVWSEVVSAPEMQTNVWYHVAGVLDGNSMKIYINGVQKGSGTSGTMQSSNANLQIGESPGFPGRVFDGMIDEVRIWKVARTQAEIQANATVDLPASTPNLVGYYKLDQIVSNKTPNEIGTSNTDGTLYGFGSNPQGAGYIPPGLDIAPRGLISPDLITAFTGPSRVKMIVANTGIQTFSNFSLGYKINNRPAYSENVTVTLAPGETYEHTFDNIVHLNQGNHQVSLFAQLANDANTTNDTLILTYDKPANGNIYEIPVFVGELHNFAAAGQTANKTVQLPDNNSQYSQILMRISVDCPGSGCDPWDQPAKISLKKDGRSYELARYITPYGKACGPWIFDITDFKSVLQGSCDIESYIQVWGPSGWLLNASLIFLQGEVPNPYQKITTLWATDNWVYGDPGVSYDLPTISTMIHANTNESHMRMTITGHGQGNTDNAAEFSDRTHLVMVDGQNHTSHRLWKEDCAQNTCSNQFGTWLYSRAGWCPGQGVDPFLVDLGTDITPGQSLDLDYELEAYTNLLNSGYNGGSHTEPHYKIHAFLVEKSDTYIDSSSYTNLVADRIVFPLQTADLGTGTAVKVLIRNEGIDVVTQPRIVLYVNDAQVADEVVSATLNPGDSLEYTFTTLQDFSPGTGYLIAAMIDAEHDAAASDDVAHVSIDIANSLDDLSELKFSVFPNPNENIFTLQAENTREGAMVKVFDMAGKVVWGKYLQMHELQGGYTLQHDFPSGTYILEVTGKSARGHQKFMVR